ncbi:UNVERIFIED_CONTAM: hypothetical protein K2H54_073751 [Gekko kuhli]
MKKTVQPAVAEERDQAAKGSQQRSSQLPNAREEQSSAAHLDPAAPKQKVMTHLGRFLTQGYNQPCTPPIPYSPDVLQTSEYSRIITEVLLVFVFTCRSRMENARLHGAPENQSRVPPVFILTGIPGLEARSIWVTALFCSLYILAILGNSLILLVVGKDQSLRKPMHLFLSMLAGSELGISLSSLPTVLNVFLLDVREIGIDACLAQMFFVHSFSIMDSGVLWAMAFDRFVAIYNPLQYATILTNSRIVMIGLGVAVRSVILMIPLPVLLRGLPFCRANILAHPYCLHSNLIRLPCADITVNSRCGLFVVLSTFGLDSLCIVLSYIMILKTVLGMASKEGRLKALNTCVSHICAVVVYYVPMIGVSMAHRFGKHASPLLHSVMANVYLLVPPVLNPVIYSIKTKEIRRALRKFFSQKSSL